MLESGGSVNSPLSARQEAFCFAGREAERARGTGGGVEKPAGAVGLGGGDDFRGRAGFDPAAGVHEDDLGGGLPGEFYVVRRHDYRKTGVKLRRRPSSAATA